MLDAMFDHPEPARRPPVFERKQGLSLVLALLAYGLAGAYGVLLAPEEQVTVELAEPEVKDFAVEEEPEDEPEEEVEPPPPPPEQRPRPKRTKKKKPKPKLVPDKLDDAPLPESDTVDPDKTYGTGAGGAGKPKPVTKPAKKPAKKQPEAKPEPRKKVVKKIDPTKPVKRPEGATPPRPDPGNKPPAYPRELRDRGIEGEVVIKLHVHRDGTVKGGKILRVTANATGAEDQELAKKLLKKAVIAAVRSWKFSPSTFRGQAISIWMTQIFPFKLTGG